MCQALTVSGTPCKFRGKYNGFCGHHADPSTIYCQAIAGVGAKAHPCKFHAKYNGFCGHHRRDTPPSPPPTPPRSPPPTPIPSPPPSPSRDCCVCLEPTEVTLRCSHPMCDGCQDMWFTKHNKTTCPYCRAKVVRRSPRIRDNQLSQITRRIEISRDRIYYAISQRIQFENIRDFEQANLLRLIEEQRRLIETV